MIVNLKDGQVIYASEAVDPRNPTPAEAQAALEFVAAERAKQDQVAALKAPSVYDGRPFGVSRADMGYYRDRKADREAVGDGFQCIILDANGTSYPILSGAAFDAFYASIKADLEAREQAALAG